MGKVIAVASWKGGNGKTTAVAAISSCLAELGYKTLCVDFDTESGPLGFALCLNVFPVTDFSDLLAGKLKIIEKCSGHPRIPNLFFLSAPVFSGPSGPDADCVSFVFDEIKKEFDYCVIDSMSAAGFKTSPAAADTLIFVAAAGRAACGASKTADAVRSFEVRDSRLLVNRALPKHSEKLRKAVGEITEKTGARLIGVIPESAAVSRALRGFTPLVLYAGRSPAYDFLDAARRLSGEDIPFSVREYRRVSDLRSASLRKIRAAANTSPASGGARSLPETAKYDPKPPKKAHENFIGPFGDPGSWARSTLTIPPGEDPVRIHTVAQPRGSAGRETVRDRMWLHDLLDDNGIPYHIEIVGYWPSRRRFAEKQYIYVEKSRRNEAMSLISAYNNPANFINEGPDGAERNITENIIGGVPQKICPSCGKEVDFDYHKCPFCKEKM